MFPCNASLPWVVACTDMCIATLQGLYLAATVTASVALYHPFGMEAWQGAAAVCALYAAFGKESTNMMALDDNPATRAAKDAKDCRLRDLHERCDNLQQLFKAERQVTSHAK